MLDYDVKNNIREVMDNLPPTVKLVAISKADRIDDYVIMEMFPIDVSHYQTLKSIKEFFFFNQL